VSIEIVVGTASSEALDFDEVGKVDRFPRYENENGAAGHPGDGEVEGLLTEGLANARRGAVAVRHDKVGFPGKCEVRIGMGIH
jgi:hypothetical protein